MTDLSLAALVRKQWGPAALHGVVVAVAVAVAVVVVGGSTGQILDQSDVGTICKYLSEKESKT